MWTCSELKGRAKNVLRFNYWPGVGASAIVSILATVPAILIMYIFMFLDFFVFLMANISLSGPRSEINFHVNPELIIPLILVILVEVCVFYALLFLFSLPLETGLFHYFNKASSYKADIKEVFFAFRKGNYTSVTGTMVLRAVLEILWSLLFIIPGIIKSFSYFLVPFILSDNPQIGARRAIRLSMEMTEGHKWHIFVLCLSFIGWFLLAMLTGGIGFYFLYPYLYATFAELYAKLRVGAIQKGITSMEELKLA